MARGGKRTPSNPYQQSGEGRYSKRTDGKAGERVVPSGGRYGDRKALETINQQATPPPASGGAPAPAGGPVGEPVDMFAQPTAFPDEPITAGVPTGAGPGPSEIIPDTDGDWIAAAARLIPTAALQRLLEWESDRA